MRKVPLLVALLCLAVVFAPAAAFAQQAPAAPEGASANQPPPAGPQAAVDACGNTPADAFGQTTPAGGPTDINTMYPKDVTGAQPITNLSSVTGIVVHAEGPYVLVQIPQEPATGMGATTPPTPDHTMAVVRLPDGCAPSIVDGSQMKAIGMPTTDGILDAETVQMAQ